MSDIRPPEIEIELEKEIKIEKEREGETGHPYIDLNRKALDGLDLKMILVRSVANYCDTIKKAAEELRHA